MTGLGAENLLEGFIPALEVLFVVETRRISCNETCDGNVMRVAREAVLFPHPCAVARTNMVRVCTGWRGERAEKKQKGKNFLI